MRDYKGLKVWQKAHALTLAINETCLRMPRERAALRSQMRRAAESISTNIVEGCSRRTQKELAAFLQISVGSSGELEYQLQLAHDYGVLTTLVWRKLHDQTIEVRRMLFGLMKKVRAAESREAVSSTAKELTADGL
jgi:four helix bundle protein